jgi:hypothetical protein
MALYVLWPNRLRRRRERKSSAPGRQGAPAQTTA